MKFSTVIRHKTEEKTENIYLKHIPAIGWTLPSVLFLMIREQLLLCANQPSVLWRMPFFCILVSRSFSQKGGDMILRLIGAIFLLSSLVLFYCEEGEIGFALLALGLYCLIGDVSFEKEEPFAEANRALKGRLWKPKQPGEES